jgi:hypothetical protein
MAEGSALRDKTVEIRRINIKVTVCADRFIAQIIRKDEEDIGLLSFRGRQYG